MVRLAQRSMNMANSLAIQCMHRGIKGLAQLLLVRAFKIDLVFAEVEDSLMRDALQGWRGRLLLLNSLAFHQMNYQKNVQAALQTLNES